MIAICLKDYIFEFYQAILYNNISYATITCQNMSKSQSLKNPAVCRKNSLLRWKGYLDDAVYTGPEVVNFHLTNFCNLGCKFCWYHSGKSKAGKVEKKYIDQAVFNKVISDCRSLGTEAILFSGEGEPLLHPNINGLIESVRACGMGLSINSNGILIDSLPSNILRCVSNFNINLSETGGRSHSSMHCGDNGSFDKVINNCRYVAALREKYGRPRLGIVFIINRHNFRHMRDALALAIGLGADSLRFKLASVNKKSKRVALTRPFLDGLRHQTRRLLAVKVPKTLKTNIPAFANILLNARFYDTCRDVFFKHGYFRTFYFDRFFEPGFKCQVGWFLALIDIRGNVFLCCNNQQFIVGNIFKDSFSDIWNGRSAQIARLKMKHDFNIEDKIWKECHYCNRENALNPFDVLYG